MADSVLYTASKGSPPTLPDDTMPLLFSLADFAMLIAIWIVQIVLYPKFHQIDSHAFPNWHRHYTRFIGYIVGPLMLIQLLSLFHPILMQTEPRILRASLISLSWFSTFFLFVPIHQKLQDKGKRDLLINRLVSMNWIRTALWTAIPLAS